MVKSHFVWGAEANSTIFEIVIEIVIQLFSTASLPKTNYEGLYVYYTPIAYFPVMRSAGLRYAGAGYNRARAFFNRVFPRREVSPEQIHKNTFVGILGQIGRCL